MTFKMTWHSISSILPLLVIWKFCGLKLEDQGKFCGRKLEDQGEFYWGDPPQHLLNGSGDHTQLMTYPTQFSAPEEHHR